MQPEKEDWRGSTVAVEAAGEIIELVGELCEPAEHGPEGVFAKVQILTAAKNGFVSAFDEAVAESVSAPVARPDDKSSTDIFLSAFRGQVVALADATGASHFEVVCWMKTQFLQAFDRKIAEAKK
jgi:hypothetical protein